MPQGIDPLLLLVFPKLYIKDSRRLFLKESTRWFSGPCSSRWLLKKVRDCGHLCLYPPWSWRHLAFSCMLDKGRTTRVSDHHFQMRVFLKIAVTTRGRERGFIHFHSLYWTFWNYCFPKFFSGDGCVIEPAIPQSLSTPNRQPGGGHYPPGASLGSLLKVPQQIRFLLGKEAWLRHAKYHFINKVLPYDEVATLAQRDAQNWIRMRATCLGWPQCFAPTTPILWFQ